MHTAKCSLAAMGLERPDTNSNCTVWQATTGCTLSPRSGTTDMYKNGSDLGGPRCSLRWDFFHLAGHLGILFPCNQLLCQSSSRGLHETRHKSSVSVSSMNNAKSRYKLLQNLPDSMITKQCCYQFISYLDQGTSAKLFRIISDLEESILTT